MTPLPAHVPYHHGDLRNALLVTATELASESGPAAVQLREAARRIGVSPSAAYRHFAGRNDLLAAVAAGVLGELAGWMRAAIAAVPDSGPAELQALVRFRAVGLAYVDYALARPGLFRTAYASGVALPGLVADGPAPDGVAPEGVAPEEPPAGAATEHPYVILAEALDELLSTGVLPAERRRHAEVAAWAGVHGLALLVLDGVLGPGIADRQELIDATLDMIGIGLCAPGAFPIG